MSDMGATLTPSSSRTDYHMHAPGFSNGYVRRSSLPGGRLRPGAPTGVLGPMLERQETQYSLQDAGGLLSSSSTTSSGRTRSTRQTPEVEHNDDANDSGYELTTLRSNDTGRLQDIGSFLAADRRPDVDRLPPQQRINDQNSRARGTASRNHTPATAHDANSYEAMSLEDPGGLLKR